MPRRRRTLCVQGPTFRDYRHPVVGFAERIGGVRSNRPTRLRKNGMNFQYIDNLFWGTPPESVDAVCPRILGRHREGRGVGKVSMMSGRMRRVTPMDSIDQMSSADAALLESVGSERVASVASRAVYEVGHDDGEVVLRSHLAEVRRSVDDLLLAIELESVRALPIGRDEAIDLARDLERLAQDRGRRRAIARSSAFRSDPISPRSCGRALWRSARHASSRRTCGAGS